MQTEAVGVYAELSGCDLARAKVGTCELYVSNASGKQY